MVKQDGPAVANPLIEVEGAFGGFGAEIGGFVANADGHGLLLLRLWGRLAKTATRQSGVAGEKSIGPLPASTRFC
jgi:hypothetical protein